MIKVKDKEAEKPVWVLLSIFKDAVHGGSENGSSSLSYSWELSNQQSAKTEHMHLIVLSVS